MVLDRGENSFQQNPLNIFNTVAVNADFKEITLEAKSRKTLKSADPLKIPITGSSARNFGTYRINEQLRFRQVWTHGQIRQNLHC